ncbi:MAG: PTS mannose/fructose/sorbose transporter subunit IIB, partial [Calditrichaeota bacterium]
MPIEMVRIDDRLIHGQVLVGWCPVIRPDRLVLCDDQVAACDWERAMYEEASPDYKTSVLSVEDTAKLLQSEAAQKERIFLVVGSPQAAEALLEKGVQVD